LTVFVDTSALLSILDRRDPHNTATMKRWTELIDAEEPLLTTNYVTVEGIAVVQRRLGIAAVRDLIENLLPPIEIVWVDPPAHERAVAALLAAAQRNLSLVDCTSFEVMRLRGLRTAFTLDPDFSAQGFQRIP